MNAPGRGPKRALAGFSALLAVVVAAFAISVPAVAAAGVAVTAGTARNAARFWTPARMARAKPIEVTPPARRGGGSAYASAERGRPLVVPPLTAASDSAATATASSAATTNFEQVADPTAPAYRVNGVIFFEDFLSFGRCSGTSVNAPNLSVVITAAHCVNSGGRHGEWFRDQWIFVPGYRYGQRPFGVFPAKWLNATPRWLREGNENADVAVAVVGRNERGQRLGAAVGAAGFAAGLKASQVFDIHGYPVARPFDGETQRICPGRAFLGHDPASITGSGPLNLGVQCRVSGGASGGGWTIRHGLLNSVTNYGYPDDQQTVYGSYFGKEVARLYHEAGQVR